MRTRRWQETLGYLLAWLISVGLTVVDLLLVRSLVLSGLTWLAVHQSEVARQADRLAGKTWGQRIVFADTAMWLVLSVIGLALVLLIEHRYRQAADAGVLRRRAAKVLAIQIAVAAVAWLIQQPF